MDKVSKGGPKGSSSRQGVTRRQLVAGGALLGVGFGIDRLLVDGSGGATRDFGETDTEPISFYGLHQAGIATTPPDFLHFAAFDVTSGGPNDLRGILEQWTLAAGTLTAGRPYRPGEGPGLAPADPGEARDLGPAQLTITIGLGPSLFGERGRDRFGLSSRVPDQLRPLPRFRGESLDVNRSDGDLCVQACAADPQVAFHAVHVLSRIASTSATLRWSQQGFGRTSSAGRSEPTPRNLMGFKDGTNNVRADDSEEMDKHVWVKPGDGQPWMENGTYLVARRIQIFFDVWDATSLEGQERVIGRHKAGGAPLGGDDEYEDVDLGASQGGELTIPADAHIRLASPEENAGRKILRRGYSYSEPSLAGAGQIDAGLFFISFQRDPHGQFVPIQRRLAASDALNRHILHTASAVFACPPGAEPGGFVGEGLFA